MCFQKNCSFLSTILAPFYRIFKKQHINLYLFNLCVILTSKCWEKILKFFFLAVKRLILRKNILAIFRIIAILKKKKKKKIIIFLVTLQSMAVPNFMSKAFSYQDLRRGGCDKTKISRADRVKMSGSIYFVSFTKSRCNVCIRCTRKNSVVCIAYYFPVFSKNFSFNSS